MANKFAHPQKLAKEDVGFEHPAKGDQSCAGCQHYESRRCEIVAGVVEPGDWCERYVKR